MGSKAPETGPVGQSTVSLRAIWHSNGCAMDMTLLVQHCPNLSSSGKDLNGFLPLPQVIKAPAKSALVSSFCASAGPKVSLAKLRRKVSVAFHRFLSFW
jgi:hypothetical protein